MSSRIKSKKILNLILFTYLQNAFLLSTEVYLREMSAN